MYKMEDLRTKLLDWQKTRQTYLEAISSLVSEIKPLDKPVIFSYFTYSLNLSHQPGQENFCLGSFHIQNIGTKPLTHPVICLQLSQNSPFEFSGKYIYKGTKQTSGLTNIWERTNDPSNKSEFWLVPKSKSILEPATTLSFSNFQVKWLVESSYSGSITGYTYGDELQQGSEVLNQIKISGLVDGEEV